jgi:hypothetical protein
VELLRRGYEEESQQVSKHREQQKQAHAAKNAELLYIPVSLDPVPEEGVVCLLPDVTNGATVLHSHGSQ